MNFQILIRKFREQPLFIIGTIFGIIGAIATVITVYPIFKTTDFNYIGSVTDEFDVPIADALIVVNTQNKSSNLKTDDAGKYTFTHNKPNLELDIEIAKAGYLPAKKHFSVSQAQPTISCIKLISTTAVKQKFDQFKEFVTALTTNFKKYENQLIYKLDDFQTYKQSEGKLFVVPYHLKQLASGWQPIIEKWLANEISLYIKNAEVVEQGGLSNNSLEILEIRAVNLPETPDAGVDILIFLKFKAYSERIISCSIKLPFCLVNFSEIFIDDHNVPDLSFNFENEDVLLEKRVASNRWFMMPKGEFKIIAKIGQLTGYHDTIKFGTLLQKPITLTSSFSEKLSFSMTKNVSYNSQVILLESNYHHIGDNEYTVDYWNEYNELLKSLEENPLPESVRINPKLLFSYALNWLNIKEKYNISETKKVIKASILLKVFLLKPRRSAPAIVAINDRPLRYLNDFVRQEEEPADVEVEIPSEILSDILIQNKCNIIITVFDDKLESLDYDKKEDFIFKNLSLKIEYAQSNDLTL